MGWNLHAHLALDQEQVEEFIINNSLDKTNHIDGDVIAAHFSPNKDIQFFYNWKEEIELHEIYSIFRVTHIRDDERFTDPSYQCDFEKKMGYPFPEMLRYVLFNICRRRDAIHVAHDLRLIFDDDPDVMCFADWLASTAENCDRYELSY